MTSEHFQDASSRPSLPSATAPLASASLTSASLPHPPQGSPSAQEVIFAFASSLIAAAPSQGRALSSFVLRSAGGATWRKKSWQMTAAGCDVHVDTCRTRLLRSGRGAMRQRTLHALSAGGQSVCCSSGPLPLASLLSSSTYVATCRFKVMPITLKGRRIGNIDARQPRGVHGPADALPVASSPQSEPVSELLPSCAWLSAIMLPHPLPVRLSSMPTL